MAPLLKTTALVTSQEKGLILVTDRLVESTTNIITAYIRIQDSVADPAGPMAAT